MCIRLLLFIPTHYKVQVLYPPQTNGVYRNHPVYPSVQMSNSLTEEWILMKLYTVAVYNLMMCLKEDNPSRNYFKGHDL